MLPVMTLLRLMIAVEAQRDDAAALGAGSDRPLLWLNAVETHDDDLRELVREYEAATGCVAYLRTRGVPRFRALVPVALGGR